MGDAENSVTGLEKRNNKKVVDKLCGVERDLFWETYQGQVELRKWKERRIYQIQAAVAPKVLGKRRLMAERVGGEENKENDWNRVNVEERELRRRRVGA